MTAPQKIIKVLRPIKYAPKDEWAVATVRLEDGSEGSVFIGGECESFFHNGQIKVHIKRNLTRGKS